MGTSPESVVLVESVRVSKIRDGYGDLRALSRSIEKDGMHNPITLWQDGTLISGGRRLRAHMLMNRTVIIGQFVSTIEEAAKCLQRDRDDDLLARPMGWMERCRAWDLLRRLDAPAAALRAKENQRKGIELRRATLAGRREPGRRDNTGTNYFLSVLAPAFGTSEATASRVFMAWNMAMGVTEVSDEKRALAAEVLRDIEQNGNVWLNYQRLLGSRSAPQASTPKRAKLVEREPASPERQLAAYAKAATTMNGLLAGLAELGPPNPALTWEQVGPWSAQLSAARRELERIIRQMKEIGNGSTKRT